MVTKVGRLRALRSRGMAFYCVSNRVGTFVTPVPHSIQRADRVRAESSVDVAVATAPSGDDGAGISDLLGLLDVNEYRNATAAAAAGGASSTSGSPAGSGSAYPLLLGATPLPPVPEPSDATYFKAHTLCSDVAYELGPALLSKVALPPPPSEKYSALSSALRPQSTSPPVRFQDQHWSADASVSSARPVPLPLAAVSDDHRLGYHMGISPAGSVTTVAPADRSSGRGGPQPALVEVRPHIVAIKVLSPSSQAASIGNLSLGPSLQQSPATPLVPQPNTVIAVDAAGNVYKWRVTSEPTHSATDVSEHVDSLSATIAQLTGGLVAPVPARSSPKGDGAPSSADTSSSYASHSALLPHVRIKLIKEGQIGSRHSPHHHPNQPHLALLPLTNVQHHLAVPALSSLAAAAATAPGGSASGPLPQPPPLVTYPIALCDMVCGALATTGCGRGGRGFELHALDARPRGAGAGSAGQAGVAATAPSPSGSASGGAANASSSSSSAFAGPVLPLGVKASASQQVKKTLNSTVTAVGNFASGNAMAPEVVPELPSWAGGGGSGGGDVSIVGSLSVPSCRSPGTSTVCAVAVDVDVMLVGYSDGSVNMWRVNGIDTLSSLISLPSLRTRPDVSLRSAGVGPVTSLAVSRDDDLAVVGYEGEAWVVELSRGRPLQCIPLSVSPAAAKLAEGCLLSNPVCTGAAIAAEGGVVISASSAVMSTYPLPSGPASAHRPYGFVSYVSLHSSNVTASPLAPPVAGFAVHARVTSLHRVRGGGTGDLEGAGAVIALGRGDGMVSLHDGRDLAQLVSWETPNRAAVFSIDTSPCTGYLVAGCANGTVAAFALPALPSVLPTPQPEVDAQLSSAGAGGSESGSSIPAALVMGAAAVASAQVEKAKGLASAGAKAATAGVKGLFGSIFGGGKK